MGTSQGEPLSGDGGNSPFSLGTSQEKSFEVSQFCADFTEIGPLIRFVLPAPLYQESQPPWTALRKLWPQTMLSYLLDQPSLAHR